jgi:putative flippase GtrA
LKILGQIIRYSIAGFIGFIINILVYLFLTEFLHVQYITAAFLSFLFPQIVTFIMDKYWSFGNRSRRIVAQFTKFVIISITALAVNLFFLYLLVEYAKLFHLIAQIIAVIISSGISFLGHRNWAFR